MRKKYYFVTPFIDYYIITNDFPVFLQIEDVINFISINKVIYNLVRSTTFHKELQSTDKIVVHNTKDIIRQCVKL